jgi:hypothetical protein
MDSVFAHAQRAATVPKYQIWRVNPRRLNTPGGSASGLPQKSTAQTLARLGSLLSIKATSNSLS